MPATATKPNSKAASKAKAVKASTEPASSVVGAKQLAEHLHTDGRTLRKFLRGQMQLSVGFGGKYTWPSLTCPEVKKVIAAWNKAHAEQAE